jgi:hypothetical protein
MPSGFSFRMVRTSYKSQDLIYEEADRKLVIYLEMAALFTGLDWVGCDVSFEKWTVPVGVEIEPETRGLILERLGIWSGENRVRIKIGPPVDLRAKLGGLGWRIEEKGNGVFTARPPRRRGFLSRFFQK